MTCPDSPGQCVQDRVPSPDLAVLGHAPIHLSLCPAVQAQLGPQPAFEQQAGAGANYDFKVSAPWQRLLFVFSHSLRKSPLKGNFPYVNSETFSVKGQIVTILGFSGQMDSVAVTKQPPESESSLLRQHGSQ